MKAQFLLQVIFLLKGVGTVCRELLFNILEATAPVAKDIGIVTISWSHSLATMQLLEST